MFAWALGAYAPNSGASCVGWVLRSLSLAASWRPCPLGSGTRFHARLFFLSLLSCHISSHSIFSIWLLVSWLPSFRKIRQQNSGRGNFREAPVRGRYSAGMSPDLLAKIMVRQEKPILMSHQFLNNLINFWKSLINNITPSILKNLQIIRLWIENLGKLDEYEKSRDRSDYGRKKQGK